MHSVLENPNIGPTDSLNCFRLQDKFPQNSFSKVSTIYPNIGSGDTPYIAGSERVIAKRGHTKNPFYQGRFLHPPVSRTQKGRICASGDRPKFFEQVYCKRAFPDGKPQLPKDVFTRRFYDKSSVDLKDAYLSVLVHESSRKFLRFIWKGACYQFKALPFGLCSAPRIFTKVLKPVAAFLRKKAIRVLIYLDDFLLLAATINGGSY